MTDFDEWESEGGSAGSDPYIAPYCFLNRHKKCLLEQFYGRDLDCECICHHHPSSMVGP